MLLYMVLTRIAKIKVVWLASVWQVRTHHYLARCSFRSRPKVRPMRMARQWSLKGAPSSMGLPGSAAWIMGFQWISWKMLAHTMKNQTAYHENRLICNMNLEPVLLVTGGQRAILLQRLKQKLICSAGGFKTPECSPESAILAICVLKWEGGKTHHRSNPHMFRVRCSTVYNSVCPFDTLLVTWGTQQAFASQKSVTGTILQVVPTCT